MTISEFCHQYVSNTLAGSANQLPYVPETPDTLCTGMSFFRVTEGGTKPYSFLYVNRTDSTFADGSVSRCNTSGGHYTLHSLQAAVTKAPDPALFDQSCPVDLTFDGKCERKVAPDEVFCTDEKFLSPDTGDYIALKYTFSGEVILYHAESIIPTFRQAGNEWIADKQLPFFAMMGVPYTGKRRIAYCGDSITQGIGTPLDSYAHWNAVLSRKLGDTNSYWNLGIGFGRAQDAASLGVWMEKIRQNDVVFVCYGVNDILQGRSAAQVMADLDTITDTLLSDGKRVVLQTVPPFDYDERMTLVWNEVNDHILAKTKTDSLFLFDNRPVLYLDADHPQNAKYGGHPDPEGCRAWGEALYEAVNGWLG